MVNVVANVMVVIVINRIAFLLLLIWYSGGGVGPES